MLKVQLFFKILESKIIDSSVIVNSSVHRILIIWSAISTCLVYVYFRFIHFTVKGFSLKHQLFVLLFGQFTIITVRRTAYIRTLLYVVVVVVVQIRIQRIWKTKTTLLLIQVVQSCIACLAAVINKVTHNHKLVKDCFQRYFGKSHVLSIWAWRIYHCSHTVVFYYQRKYVLYFNF